MNCPVNYPPLPTRRVDPLMPPPEYAKFRQEAPVTKVLDIVGGEAWLVTRYADIRAVLGDTRFSPNFDPPEIASARNPDDTVLPFIRLDPPEHTRYRRVLTGEFTVRQTRLLEPGIRRIVDQRLDELERAGPGADLVDLVAMPIPSLVICELLGVSYADHEHFQEAGRLLVTKDLEPAKRLEAADRLRGYMADLVAVKRRAPDTALISRLIARSGEMEEPFSDEELASIALLLLLAGHETTANMISLTTVALLRQPEKVKELRTDPSVVDKFVEESLRLLTIIHLGIRRLATEDLEVGGQLIRKGEWLLLAIGAGNRDPEVFAEPDEFDATRKRISHLSFGFGPHQCLGQQLARVEMQVTLSALFQRFPTLRVDLPNGEDIPYKHDMLIYGVHRLPVAW